MTQRPFAVVWFVLGFLLALSAAAYAQDPNVGSWRVDLAKSKYNPADLAPKSVTVKSSAAGKGVNVVVDVVDYTGKPLHYELLAAREETPFLRDPERDRAQGDGAVLTSTAPADQILAERAFRTLRSSRSATLEHRAHRLSSGR